MYRKIHVERKKTQKTWGGGGESWVKRGRVNVEEGDLFSSKTDSPHIQKNSDGAGGGWHARTWQGYTVEKAWADDLLNREGKAFGGGKDGEKSRGNSGPHKKIFGALPFRVRKRTVRGKGPVWGKPNGCTKGALGPSVLYPFLRMAREGNRK